MSSSVPSAPSGPSDQISNESTLYLPGEAYWYGLSHGSRGIGLSRYGDLPHLAGLGRSPGGVRSASSPWAVEGNCFRFSWYILRGVSNRPICALAALMSDSPSTPVND